MRWMKALLIVSCASSSLLLANCAGHQQLIADSYCQVYEPIIQKKGDANISAPLVVKSRILYNEQMYRNECKGQGK